MSEYDEALDQLQTFVDRFGGAQIKSTGAKRVRYTKPLYNVVGSTGDPRINGCNWKQLLEKHDVAGPCFVTNVPADPGSKHPEFEVGGHMTPNKDGSVPIGGVSYLMPLCKWHNHPARNHQAFERSQEIILELQGYMLSEPAATFMARQPENGAYSLVSMPARRASSARVDAVQSSSDKDALTRMMAKQVEPSHFILFKQVQTDDGVFYTIDDVGLR